MLHDGRPAAGQMAKSPVAHPRGLERDVRWFRAAELAARSLDVGPVLFGRGTDVPRPRAAASRSAPSAGGIPRSTSRGRPSPPTGHASAEAARGDRRTRPASRSRTSCCWARASRTDRVALCVAERGHNAPLQRRLVHSRHVRPSVSRSADHIVRKSRCADDG